MEVTKVSEKRKVAVTETIKYQIITYCFFNDISITSTELDCLCKLAEVGKVELTPFCKLVKEHGIFKSAQSARNSLTKAEKKGLVTKNGNGKKTITINKDLNIQTSSPIFLDYKILGVEA